MSNNLMPIITNPIKLWVFLLSGYFWFGWRVEDFTLVLC